VRPVQRARTVRDGGGQTDPFTVTRNRYTVTGFCESCEVRPAQPFGQHSHSANTAVRPTQPFGQHSRSANTAVRPDTAVRPLPCPKPHSVRERAHRRRGNDTMIGSCTSVQRHTHGCERPQSCACTAVDTGAAHVAGRAMRAHPCPRRNHMAGRLVPTRAVNYFHSRSVPAYTSDTDTLLRAQMTRTVHLWQRFKCHPL